MKVKNLISLIVNTDFYSINEAIKAANLKKCDCVVENYNVSRHKYFNIVTNIYRCEDGFVGITGLNNNRRKRSYQKFNIITFAEVYQEIQTVSYLPKYKKPIH